MIEYTFEPNKLYTNQEHYDALTEYFNKIDNLAKNKKLEWEDDTSPSTETYKVTTDFKEWFETVIPALKDYFIHFKYQISEDFENNTLKYTEELKPYIDGFLLDNVGMFEGKSMMADTVSKDTFEEIVECAKELNQNNIKVFLYQVYHRPARAETTVEDTATYYEIDSQYTLRYGAIKND